MKDNSFLSLLDNFGLLILSIILFLGGAFILSLKIPFWSLFLGIASIQIGIVLIIITYEIITRRKSKVITENYKTIPCLICKKLNYVPKYQNTTICDSCQLRIAKSAKSFMIVVFALFSLTSFTFLVKNNQDIRKKAIIETPIPFNPYPYQKPTIPKKQSYLTFIVGDSMVKALGKNANELRLDLIKYYPNNEFVNYNYGFSATNILSLPKIFNEGVTVDGETFLPIIKEGFDLIIIESFAYNPLSDFSIDEGLKKQTETLDYIVKLLIKDHPNSVIAIMATIAPSKKYFAQSVYDISLEERQKWVEERISYINNAIIFAKDRNIPLINVYEKSLTENGEANLKYIDPNDFIHPSDEGIRLISKTIADFIYENRIFPE
ncbi:hypothetical protein A2W13_00165 [Candidatus Woesebacteria bacterium RBG_16_36_11]|uniref:Uncharacterized protein n=2 Tax=Candidatus Woeseibacteriota TaxID=1752722 RepID=A0A1F7X7B0_9BACT|nr:MAG: hypothetical protein A2W13_00165 [Candidatus Woesebacteria bacterium RBG_16_36_11]OGM17037.1 MAG: hypothetical protein A2V55_02230 [Candidatus Woesebacteria bacterium RBG_19FT_COMBO_37_29]